MTTKNTRKIFSMIVAFVMILTCLVSPAMANPVESYDSAEVSRSATINAETGEVKTVTTPDTLLDPNREITILVELEGETLFQQTGDLQIAATGFDGQAVAMAKAENRIEKALGQSIEIDATYSLLFTGFSFVGQGWMIDAINEMDGITAYEDGILEMVQPETTDEINLTPSMGTSTGTIGATAAWELGYTGEGMVVAVLDTGIRRTHEAFSVMPKGGKIDKAYLEKVFAEYGTKLHCGTDANAIFYNDKLPFNWDYFDGDANPNHTASDHGTHVAGIAAGNNGADFKGVAPDAQIATFQVFNDAGGAAFSTLIQAMEDCIYLGVDAINMSLGVAAFFTAYESIGGGMEEVYTSLENAGISVCVAAGNDGTSTYWTNPAIGYNEDYFAWNLDVGTIGAPATFPGSFSVASVTNTSGGGWFTGYGKEYYPTAIAGNPSFGELENKEYDIVYVGLGSPEEIAATGGVEGKIALVQRGVHTFTLKTENAAAAGAVGVIIYNNVSGAFNPAIASPIPVGAMTMEDGEALIANFTDGVHGKITVDTGMAYRAIGMAASSSWGTTADLKLKPEISAPGDGVTSAIGFGGDADYQSWSGTSMATPHIAGAMLLVKQRLREVYPEKTAAEINELAYAYMMSTAHQTSGFVRQAGAGLIDLEGALTTDAYLTVPGSARPKIELDDNAEGEFTMTIEVTNDGDESLTYDVKPVVIMEKSNELNYIGYRSTGKNGNYNAYNQKYPYWMYNRTHEIAKTLKGQIMDVTNQITFNGPKAVTVKAGETVTLVLTAKVDDSLMNYIEENFPVGMYFEGYITLKARSEVADLSVPFLGFIGDWDYAPMFDLGFWWNLPYGEFNWAQMPHSKGTYLGSGVYSEGLGLNYYWDETDETYLADRNAISPNGDGLMETVDYIEFALMRNPKTLKLYVADAEGDMTQLLHESAYNYRKEYFVQGWNGGTGYSNISFSYDASELEENETAYIVLEGWLDHEEYQLEDNMNGRMVFPVTKDTIAPAVAVIDGGVEIQDANYIAYYAIYADGARTNKLFETGVFAEERGVAETYATDLDTYFVAVADYARNEAFYMVKDGKLYEMDVSGFDNLDRTIIARQNINWSTGNYQFGWYETMAEVPNYAKPISEVTSWSDYVEAGIYYADFVDGVVANDGTVYVSSTYNLYTMNPKTWEMTHVGKYYYPGETYAASVRSLIKNPETGEIFAWAYINASDKGVQGRHFAKVDLETGELIPIWRLRDDAWYAANVFNWGAEFLDGDTLVIWADYNGGVIHFLNAADGSNEGPGYGMGLTSPNGESQLGNAGFGGHILVDRENNKLYLYSNTSWTQLYHYDSGAFICYDLDTMQIEKLTTTGPGHSYHMTGIFFEDELFPEKSDCIYYREEIAPTCTAEGYTLHTCVDCGKQYRDNFVPALDHTYEGVVTEPTCADMGYTTYTCTACGDSYVDDYTLPIDHEFVEVVIEPTCTEAGYTIYMCECGYEVIGDVTDPVGHNYAVNVIEPTCGMHGFTEHICVDCGHYYVSDYTAPYCPAAEFADVALDAWYHEAVDFVVDLELMNGMNETTFAPEANMTRAQLVTVLYRLAGEPAVEGLENPFADVAADTWYTDAVIWAYNEGVVNGTSETTFTPNANITREQLVAVLYRFVGEPEADTTVLEDYTDADSISEYAVPAMAWAVEYGVVNGMTKTTLAPQGTATRAQIATILMRFVLG